MPQTTKLFYLFSSLILFALFIQVILANFDSAIIKHLLKPIFSLAAALLICSVIGKRLTLALLIDYILTAALLQAVISFILFLNPDIYDYTMSFIEFDDIQRSNVLGLVRYRLVGVGNSIWFGAANYGIDLLLLASLPYVKGSYFFKNKFLYYLTIVIVIIAGVLSARTFFTVFIVVGLYLFLVRKSSNTKLIGRVFRIVAISAISLPILLKVASSFIDFDRLETVSSWAFEMFKSFDESHVATTHSSERMAEMYHHVPDDLGGWLLGEGQYENADGSYYKDTDIGYIRLILYFGIIGLFYYLFSIYKFYKYTSRLYYKEIRYLILCILFFELILLGKGIISLSIYVSLFYVTGIFINKNNKVNYERKAPKQQGVSNSPML